MSLNSICETLRSEMDEFEGLHSFCFIRHIDGNTLNNVYTNLQWVSLRLIIENPTWTVDHVLYLNAADFAYIENLRALNCDQ